MTTSPGHLDVVPTAVVHAGHKTAATSEAWLTWGARVRLQFQYAETTLRNTKVFDAMEEYGEITAARANHIGQQIGDLGVNTAAAGSLVDDADLDSATLLTRPGSTAIQQGPLLTRPVNGTGTPT